MSNPSFISAFFSWLDDELAAGRKHVELSAANREFLAAQRAAAPAPATAPRPAMTAPPAPAVRAPAPPPAPAPGAPPRPTTPPPVAAPRPAPAAPVPPARTSFYEPPAGAAMELAAAPLPDLKQYDLAQLAELVRPCQRCGLCKGRQQTVFGDGHPRAELMFVGEGPGADEDASGLPFVGAAGQLLDKMIVAMNFRRSDVYIANIVKCRPPGNRNPEPDEAAACLPYLRRQIELVQPRVLVVLGNVPLRFLLGRTGITSLRGQWLDYQGIPTMPTYHPSYLLRVPDKKRECWQDLQEVMRRLGHAPRAAG